MYWGTEIYSCRNTCACAVSLCEALTMLLSSLTSKNNTEKSELHEIEACVISFLGLRFL